MVFKGCERSVITYSSLISACEKAGQSDLAMELFQEMAQEGCVPNTVTYNSLITACAQGRASRTLPACAASPASERGLRLEWAWWRVFSLSPACHIAMRACARGIDPHLGVRSWSAHPLTGPASRCLRKRQDTRLEVSILCVPPPQVERLGEAGSAVSLTLLGAMQEGSGRRPARCSSRCSGRA